MCQILPMRICTSKYWHSLNSLITVVSSCQLAWKKCRVFNRQKKSFYAQVRVDGPPPVVNQFFHMAKIVFPPSFLSKSLLYQSWLTMQLSRMFVACGSHNNINSFNIADNLALLLRLSCCCRSIGKRRFPAMRTTRWATASSTNGRRRCGHIISVRFMLFYVIPRYWQSVSFSSKDLSKTLLFLFFYRSVSWSCRACSSFFTFYYEYSTACTCSLHIILCVRT